MERAKRLIRLYADALAESIFLCAYVKALSPTWARLLNHFVASRPRRR